MKLILIISLYIHVLDNYFNDSARTFTIRYCICFNWNTILCSSVVFVFTNIWADLRRRFLIFLSQKIKAGLWNPALWKTIVITIFTRTKVYDIFGNVIEKTYSVIYKVVLNWNKSKRQYCIVRDINVGACLWTVIQQHRGQHLLRSSRQRSAVAMSRSETMVMCRSVWCGVCACACKYHEQSKNNNLKKLELNTSRLERKI